MGLIENIYKWCNFQSRYDQIKSWKLNPQQQTLVDTVWDKLSPALQKALWGLITMILAKYGPDAAKNILASVLQGINKEA